MGQQLTSGRAPGVDEGLEGPEGRDDSEAKGRPYKERIEGGVNKLRGQMRTRVGGRTVDEGALLLVVEDGPEDVGDDGGPADVALLRAEGICQGESGADQMPVQGLERSASARGREINTDIQ